MTKKEPFSEQLRRAVRESELSRYEMSKRTGISQSILSRFLNAGAGLSMDSVDKLMACLGLRLTAEEGEAGRTKQKGK